MQGRRWFLGHGHDHIHHTNMKVSWIHDHINGKDGIFTHPPPVNPSPPYGAGSNPHTLGSRISPPVFFIVVILSVLFFISGLLHLLVRFLTRNAAESRGNQEASTSDALQMQLQQLFHLQDSGLDQALIDSLAVFTYKEVVGRKELFDCAVCLSEFSETDSLRLLPTCSHAFHINCIDTWLVSNSTCPLCRGTLANLGVLVENPIFDFQEEDQCQTNSQGFSIVQKRLEIDKVARERGVFPVRLGKFKKLKEAEGGEVKGEGSSSSKLDTRRCYSFSTYQYVIGDSILRVPLSRAQAKHNPKLSGGVDQQCCSSLVDGNKLCVGAKADSYSVSKIWLWSKNVRLVGSFSDDQLGNSSSSSSSSSYQLDFPWMHKT